MQEFPEPPHNEQDEGQQEQHGTQQPELTAANEHKRAFHITPKTPNSELQAVKNWPTATITVEGQTHSMRDVIARDIAQNFSEVASDIGWGEALQLLQVSARGSVYRGERAIAQGMAQTLGSTAAGAGWDMHSPEVVYMSAYHCGLGLTERISTLEKGIEAIREGKRKFETQEQMLAKLKSDDEEAARLKLYRMKYGDDLDQYAEQALGGSPEYTAFLRDLAYITNAKLKPTERAHVLSAAAELSRQRTEGQFDQTKLQEAHTLLLKNKI